MIDKIIRLIKDMSIKARLWLKKNITIELAMHVCESTEETRKQIEVIEETKPNEINKEGNVNRKASNINDLQL